MTSLGTLRLDTFTGVLEARRKVRSAILELTKDEILATRLGTMVSVVGRDLSQHDGSSSLEVTAHDAGFGPHLAFLFRGTYSPGMPGLVERFSSSVDTAIDKKGTTTLRAAIPLPGASLPAAKELSTARVILLSKSKDELTEEIKTKAEELEIKNVELQESLDNLRRTTTAKERMEGELNIGREIQLSMLPLEFPAFPHRKDFDVFATLEPAREVGGDFYDFFLIDEDNFCFCVGDVSGKGVPAALFMAVTKTLIKSRATNDLSPASIMTHVNDELAFKNDSAMFVTLWLAILDLRTGGFRYCNAGHNPPYLRRAGDGGLIRLDKRHGPVVGAMEGMAYGEDEGDLDAGDVIFLYTDGVTEAMDPGGQLYEEDRLVSLLDTAEYETVEEMVKASADDVWRFQAEADQADDVTILAVHYHGDPFGQAAERRLDLVLKNTIPEIGRAVGAFETFAEGAQIPIRAVRALNLALDDLLNNVVSYAYEDEREHEIRVHVELGEGRVTLTIRDDGRPFNPFGSVDPDTSRPLEDREIGGLGIHLVEQMMDKVEYHRRIEENVVTVVKYIDN
jgi:sigma-B regulation protein RsbU (phosphoserine phosphatase)